MPTMEAIEEDIKRLKRKDSTVLKSKQLRGNITRQQLGRDPQFYYNFHETLGSGSIGDVVRVAKRESVVGGSSRQDLQALFERDRAAKNCYKVPLVGRMLRSCVPNPLEDISEGPPKRNWLPRKVGKFQSIGSGATIFSSPESSIRSFSFAAPQRVYAIKSIHHDLLKRRAVVQELRNEIDILKQLDHPNIIRLIETFDHRKKLSVVMEHCCGGDLYTRDPYSEEEAGRIIRSLLSALTYMHSHKIMHRDIKFENILFVDDSRNADVKLIDFGLSKVFRSSALTERVGTLYTMAPEVLKGRYTYKADLWSVGVIAYMLLSSQVPFMSEKSRETITRVLAGNYSLKGERWENISDEAKSLIQRLLVVNPLKRASAQEALSSPWFEKLDIPAMHQPSMEDFDCAKMSLLRYANYPTLKKFALMIVAHYSSTEEIGMLRTMFQKYNKSMRGDLSFREFVDIFSDSSFDEIELRAVFDEVNLDGTGMLRYTEFLAATIEMHGPITQDQLAEAFDRLDYDDSGTISVSNLINLLGAGFKKNELRLIINECKVSHRNIICYDQFLSLWEDSNDIQIVNSDSMSDYGL